jgi:sugar-phosphatase
MDGLLSIPNRFGIRLNWMMIASLGVDISRRHELPDTLGLRIDMVVDLWFAQQPWNGPHVRRSPSASSPAPLRWKNKPLLPAVREAVALCKSQGIKEDWHPPRRCICWKKC